MVLAYEACFTDVPAAVVRRAGAKIIDFESHRRRRDPLAAANQGGGPVEEGLIEARSEAGAALFAEQRRRRDIQHAFARYVAPEIVEQLVENPASLSLGGEIRELTIVFADIRGFTAMSEMLKDDPQRLNHVINAVLGPLSDIIVAHGGTIDKYIGDSVMAFWGAPLADRDHAERAVDAAMAMLAAMDGINAGLAGACPMAGCCRPSGSASASTPAIASSATSGRCAASTIPCSVIP